jgi:hypothetical protein
MSSTINQDALALRHDDWVNKFVVKLEVQYFKPPEKMAA